MPSPQKLFKQEAAILIRDLRQGTVQPHEVDDYIKSSWEKDSDEYSDAYGVNTFSEFHKGIRAILDKRPGGKKTVKKTASHSHKKKAIKKAITKHEGLLAKLKRKWRSL